MIYKYNFRFLFPLFTFPHTTNLPQTTIPVPIPSSVLHPQHAPHPHPPIASYPARPQGITIKPLHEFIPNLHHRNSHAPVFLLGSKACITLSSSYHGTAFPGSVPPGSIRAALGRG